VSRNFDLWVFVYSDVEIEQIQSTLDGIRGFIESGENGFHSLERLGIWFLVKDRPPPPSGWTNNVGFLAHDKTDPAVFQMAFEAKFNAAHQAQVANWKTARLFSFDSHKLKQIKYSLDRARSKAPDLPAGEFATVCINLHPAEMNLDAASIYAEVMARELGMSLWSGGQNSHIQALAISCGPIYLNVTRDGQPARVVRYAYFESLSRALASHPNCKDSPVYQIFGGGATALRI
jgi:hypothetical protein